MYKTVWVIIEDNFKTNLTYYHFGKSPKFPSWYMEKNKVYTVEMIFNFPLCNTLKAFFKCLTHFYIIK